MQPAWSVGVFCFTSKARFSPVILSAAKDLAAYRDNPFAEFTLSEVKGSEPALERSEGVTRCDSSNC